MRIEQLQYFETLIQEGSYTKAAAQLHIAQPSLTASIKAMEKELDTLLIIRDTTGIRLTDEGEKVLRFAQAVLKLHENLLTELNPVPHPNENITVFAANFFYKIILENFLPTFFKNMQIQVRSVESDFAISLESFFIHNCNFAVVSRLTADDESKCVPGMLIQEDKFFYDDLIYIPIFQTPMGVCMSNHSSYLYTDELTPMYLLAANASITMFPNRYFKLSERVLFSSSTIAPHIDAISQNKAICSMPYFAFQYYFAQEDCLVFRPYTNNITHTYYLVYPKTHTLTAAEQVFVEELANFLRHRKMN